MTTESNTDNIFWTFQDIADYTGKKYRYVRDRLMKEEGAPLPVIGRDTFLAAEVIRFLVSRQGQRRAG